MTKIKLIWDFRGPNAKNTAKHHLAHLEDYFKIEKIHHEHLEQKLLNDMHAIACVVVNEPDVRTVRDALKPHRGQLFSD
ncbi:hypothetical protein [Ascidiimonas sp. W6]|uniref:hypothetical protein n=1 Tax=Ascidiimonas meishanensis TaxID=3128903 RepID=UPI0030EF5A08